MGGKKSIIGPGGKNKQKRFLSTATLNEQLLKGDFFCLMTVIKNTYI